MTKQEFIQEAALRILARDSESSMISIADYAAELAAEVWKRFGKEPEQHEEPEVLTAFAARDTVQVVAREIARLETEFIEAENAKLKEKGHSYRRQKSGADIRFLNCCSYDVGYQEINTVTDLIAYGRNNFICRRNIGRKTIKLVDKALGNLYNIKSW